jgi:hypothetical protein
MKAAGVNERVLRLMLVGIAARARTVTVRRHPTSFRQRLDVCGNVVGRFMA